MYIDTLKGGETIMHDYYHKPVAPAPPVRPAAGFAFILVLFILLVIIGAALAA
jgi:uncharacterized protein (TIGR01732 family)